MDPQRRARLEHGDWTAGTFTELLGLTPEESAELARRRTGAGARIWHFPRIRTFRRGAVTVFVVERLASRASMPPPDLEGIVAVVLADGLTAGGSYAINFPVAPTRAGWLTARRRKRQHALAAARVVLAGARPGKVP